MLPVLNTILVKKNCKFSLFLLNWTVQNCNSPSAGVSMILSAVCQLHFVYLKKYSTLATLK